MYLLAGLGNPGSEYANTRHNIGFITIDLLAESLGIKVDKLKFKSLTAECRIGTEKVLLMKPQTFMNNSGEAIGEAARFYKIPPENVVIISDDISLSPGKLRIRRKGSAGGHNGLKSIIAHLGSENFPRVKLGIGDREHPNHSLADFVLGKFSKDEMELVEEVAKKASDAASLIIAGNVDEAMNRYN